MRGGRRTRRASGPDRLRGVLLAALLLAGTSAAAGQEPYRAGGDGIIHIGTYGQEIVRVDEATGEILEPIPLRHGIPRSMVPNADRTRFYVLDVSYEHVEVVDVASRRSLGSFTLSDGPDSMVRIWGLTIHPAERHAILLTKRTLRLPDRFEVGDPTLVRWDLEAGRVLDTIPWPGGDVREGVRMVYSPDGALLYFFAEEAILALETEGFTQVDRWEYGTALDPGMGRFEFGFPEQHWGDPGEMTGLFRVSDPIQGRRTMGVATVTLADRAVHYTPLGPSESVSFVMAPDGRKAYGLQQEVGNWHFWTFDLEAGRVERRDRFAGRPRMSLMTSSNGELLYIYNAGNTIDIYEADSYRLLRTIDLPGDNTTSMFILPRSADR